jgi:outer membrane murein-binding lipoprotein Lpp
MIAASNFAAWAQSITIGGTVSAITLVGGALLGLVVLSIRQIGSARAENIRVWDEANKATLSTQVADLSASVATLRENLHASRNESQAREMTHADEVARFGEQIKMLLDQVRYQTDANLQLRREIARNTAATDRVQASLSGDDIPVDQDRDPSS